MSGIIAQIFCGYSDFYQICFILLFYPSDTDDTSLVLSTEHKNSLQDCGRAIEWDRTNQNICDIACD